MVRRSITLNSGLEKMIQEFRGELMTISGGNMPFSFVLEQLILFALIEENKDKIKNMHKRFNKVTNKMTKELEKIQEELKKN